MVGILVQCIVIGVWATVFGIHTRRLLRLAQVETMDSLRNHPLRIRLHRVWWWLGREEFWLKVQRDCVYCLQVTLMIFVAAWGLLG